MERLKIAVQKSGRLNAESVDLLRACGLDLDGPKQRLYTPCRNFELDMIAVRDDDIPRYVSSGVADLGIVGGNTVGESGVRLETLAELGFGACRLMICVPQHGALQSVEQLAGRRVATGYPLLLADYLRRAGVACEVVRLSGAVEIAPVLGVADAICDLVSTGTTARVNGLHPIATVMESQALLVGNADALRDPVRRGLIHRLMMRVRGCLDARGRRYLMMNAPAHAVPGLRAVLPSMKSPTVMPLADDGMVAVHSVIGEDLFWDVMERLKEAGASDIVVVPIEAIVR